LAAYQDGVEDTAWCRLPGGHRRRQRLTSESMDTGGFRKCG
jgi:hypothetical protein